MAIATLAATGLIMAAPLRYFFYGTLIAGSGNPVAQAVHEKLIPCGPARTVGRLWAIPDADGWYPAKLPGEDWVHGMLYQATPAFDAMDEARLDGWEDCRPEAMAESLYWRQAAIVISGKARRLRAQMYMYNRSLPRGAREIKHGDFSKWLVEHDYRAFGA